MDIKPTIIPRDDVDVPQPHKGLRLTFPIVLNCLRSHWRTLFFLFLASLLLGIAPTLKSELEAGVLDQISQCIRHTQTLCEPNAQLERFSRGAGVHNDGIAQLIISKAFSGITSAVALLAFFAIAAFSALLQWGSFSFSSKISAEIFASLRNLALRNSLAADAHQIDSLTNAPGQFANAIERGANSVSGMYTNMILAGQDLFAIATVLTLLWTTNIWFSMFCLIMVIIQIAMSVFQAHKLQSLREQYDRGRNALIASTDDILSKREIIAAYEQQDRYTQRIDHEARLFANRTRKMDVTENLFGNISSLITDYGRIVVLVGAATIYYLFDAEHLGDVGDAYFFVSIYARLLSPAANLVGRYEHYRRTRDTSRRFLNIIDNGIEPTPDQQATPIESNWKRGSPIVFKNVKFKYPGSEKTVLNDCSMSLPALRTTLLLGPSGCGKSTIARLLLGFWQHNSGGIQLGDAAIESFSSHMLREQMSYVAQGDHIVDETVRENLMWVDRGRKLDEKDLIPALDRVGLNGEGILDGLARDLSLGQQQRLSIARMMLDQSEIIIMDEPMAGVDLTTLSHVLPPLQTLLKSGLHTVVIISHRLSFASLADHVVLMDKGGTVIEEGPPETLINAGGKFSELFAAARAELIS